MKNVFIMIALMSLALTTTQAHAANYKEETLGRVEMVKRTFTLDLEECLKNLRIESDHEGSCTVNVIRYNAIENVSESRNSKKESVLSKDYDLAFQANRNGYTVSLILARYLDHPSTKLSKDYATSLLNEAFNKGLFIVGEHRTKLFKLQGAHVTAYVQTLAKAETSRLITEPVRENDYDNHR